MRAAAYSFVLAITFLSVGVHAQTPDSGLNIDIRSWANFQSRRPPVYFLALDKQTYNIRENILYSIFTVDGGSQYGDSIVYLALVDFSKGKIVAQDRYLFVGGIGTGSLLIPDTLYSGDYLFVAFTEGTALHPLGRPFRQVVTIRAGQQPFRFTNTELLRIPAKPDSIRWHAKIITDYGGVAAGGQFRYTVRSGGKLICTGEKAIDAFGEIDLLIPARDTVMDCLYLWSHIKRKREVIINKRRYKVTDSCELYTPIIANPDRVDIHYFPESGHLVSGLATRMGVSITRGLENGVSTRATLYSDTIPVATMHTDLYGMGSFVFVPVEGEKYTVRIDQQWIGSYLVGEFPRIESEGVIARLPGGVLKDTMSLTLESTQDSANYKLMVYSPTDILYSATISSKTNFTTARLYTGEWPKGLARMIVFSADNISLAERTIYLEPNAVKAVIETDSSLYCTRSKVLVKVTLSDKVGNPVQGVLAFGSSLGTRLRPARVPNITMEPLEGPFDEHADLPRPPPGYLETHQGFEMYLLNGMGGYLTWKQICQDTAPIKRIDSVGIRGYVTCKNNPLKQPCQLLLLKSHPQFLKTDSSGRFEITKTQLLSSYGSDPILSVYLVSDPFDYKIYYEDKNTPFSRHLAETILPTIAIKPDTAIEVGEEKPTAFGEVKTLKEIVLKKGNVEDDGIWGKAGECPDYVCFNHILNCPVHHSNDKPQKGRYYFAVVDPYDMNVKKNGMGQVEYTKCVSCYSCNVDPNMFSRKLPGIHLPGDFYIADSLKPVGDQQVISTTLFWIPLTLTDTNGEFRFYFYANDVPGKFINLIQGVSRVGPFRAQAAFSVTAPPK
jgi:hypothetical protein